MLVSMSKEKSRQSENALDKEGQDIDADEKIYYRLCYSHIRGKDSNIL